MIKVRKYQRQELPQKFWKDFKQDNERMLVSSGNRTADERELLVIIRLERNRAPLDGCIRITCLAEDVDPDFPPE